MRSIVRLGCAAVAATAIQVAVAAAQATTQRQETLAIVRAIVTSGDRAFTDAGRARALGLLDSVAARSESLSDLAFELRLARVVALADNGHSLLPPGPRAGRTNRVGVRLLPLSDGLLVVHATRDLRDLLGATLVSIGGIPVQRMLAENRALYGG